MKFVRQFMIILAISFVGELLHALLPLPVPASIYGLVLMLIGLQTGILPLNAVNEAGGFLIEIMPMLFIPAGVGLMVSWGALKPVIIPISIIIVVTTILVMAVSGRIAQFILKKEDCWTSGRNGTDRREPDLYQWRETGRRLYNHEDRYRRHRSREG